MKRKQKIVAVAAVLSLTGIGFPAATVVLAGGSSACYVVNPEKATCITFRNTSKIHVTFSVDGNYAGDVYPGDTGTYPILIGRHTITASGDNGTPSFEKVVDVAADGTLTGTGNTSPAGAIFSVGGDATGLQGTIKTVQQVAQHEEAEARQDVDQAKASVSDSTVHINGIIAAAIQKIQAYEQAHIAHSDVVEVVQPQPQPQPQPPQPQPQPPQPPLHPYWRPPPPQPPPPIPLPPEPPPIPPDPWGGT